MYRPVALHFQRQLVFLSPNILFTYNSGEASMIITESQLREIIQEETIMYRVLNDGRLNESLLDEGKIKDTKESIMNFFRNKLRKPMTSVVALGIALSLGAAANKSYSPEELGEMGFKPDQIAQVEQGVEALGSNVDSLEIALPSQEVSAADLPEKRSIGRRVRCHRWVSKRIQREARTKPLSRRIIVSMVQQVAIRTEATS